jgi:hypothetical protein
MIRIDTIWLALGASDLRGGIDRLLAMVVHGFALGAQPHHAYVFANRRANQTTFSIPIVVCGDRVPVASAPWQEGSVVPAGGQEGPASRTRRSGGWPVQGTAGVDV